MKGTVGPGFSQIFAAATGAVGQAGAQGAPECALFGVATMDSVTNYGTQAAPIMTPAAGASAQVCMSILF